MGLTDPELAAVARMSIEASGAPREPADAVLKRVDSWLDGPHWVASGHGKAALRAGPSKCPVSKRRSPDQKSAETKEWRP